MQKKKKKTKEKCLLFELNLFVRFSIVDFLKIWLKVRPVVDEFVELLV